MNKTKIMEYLRSNFDRYKYVLIVCLFGLALVCFPSGGENVGSVGNIETVTNQAEISELEAKLEDILSNMAGVGRVKVVLSAKSSGESVYAYDEDKRMTKSSDNQSADTSSSLVTIGSSGSQQPVVIRTNNPEYRGAFIVCDGADVSKIKLEITQAISSLTGITSDNIVISKMK